MTGRDKGAKKTPETTAFAIRNISKAATATTVVDRKKKKGDAQSTSLSVRIGMHMRTGKMKRLVKEQLPLCRISKDAIVFLCALGDQLVEKTALLTEKQRQEEIDRIFNEKSERARVSYENRLKKAKRDANKRRKDFEKQGKEEEAAGVQEEDV